MLQLWCTKWSATLSDSNQQSERVNGVWSLCLGAFDRAKQGWSWRFQEHAEWSETTDALVVTKSQVLSRVCPFVAIDDSVSSIWEFVTAKRSAEWVVLSGRKSLKKD